MAPSSETSETRRHGLDLAGDARRRRSSPIDDRQQHLDHVVARAERRDRRAAALALAHRDRRSRDAQPARVASRSPRPRGSRAGSRRRTARSRAVRRRGSPTSGRSRAARDRARRRARRRGCRARRRARSGTPPSPRKREPTTRSASPLASAATQRRDLAGRVLAVAVDLDRDVVAALQRDHVAGLHRAADAEVERQAITPRAGARGDRRRCRRSSRRRSRRRRVQVERARAPRPRAAIVARLVEGRHDREAAQRRARRAARGTGRLAPRMPVRARHRSPAEDVAGTHARRGAARRHRRSSSTTRVAGGLGACLDGLAGAARRAFEVDRRGQRLPPTAPRTRPRAATASALVRNAENVGFGAACNQAAGARRAAAHLAFLNHDSVPEPGWLAALVAGADDDPGVGAVAGDRAACPTARQHGGNRLHYLGFSWAPAGGEPPRGPPYEMRPARAPRCSCRARRLRARSAASGSELFLYCEDTDLSWRLRLAGCGRGRARGALEHDYEFGAQPEKLFQLERNRLLVLRANYEAGDARAARAAADRHGGGAARDRRAGRMAAAEAPGRARGRRARSRAARPAPPRAAGAAGRRRVDRLAASRARLGPEFGAAVAALSAPPLRAYARVARLSARS